MKPLFVHGCESLCMSKGFSIYKDMGLIKIHEREGKQVISAKDLYTFLGNERKHWARWYKKNIVDNDFLIRDVDYEAFTIMVKGNETYDFALTLDTAKRLSMMARSKKGEEVRKYFIECEKQLTKPKELSRMEILSLAMEAEKENEKLKEQIKIDAPKVEFANTFKSLPDDDTITIEEFAKTSKIEFGLGRNAMFKKMREIGWIMLGSTMPKQSKINAKYCVVRDRQVETAYGVKIVTQTFLTPKGKIKLWDELKRLG